MSRTYFSTIALATLCIAFGTAHAASESRPARTLETALETEKELTSVIERVSAAFVFVGGGSGVVISSDGYILTNHHVAGDKKVWTVRIQATGKLYVCDLAGTDPVGDLALLKVRDAKNLQKVDFGDVDKLRVGQQVLAIGDPFKLGEPEGEPAVSIGTISALHRFQGNYCDAIQTDSAINPGNSGGPLLSLDGKLVGITGQIMSRFGAKANSGIGYAIPADQIQRFLPLLKKADGKFVYHGTLPDGVTFEGRVDDAQRAVVESVDPGSDAQRAGFKVNDQVISIDGKPVHNYARLLGILRSYPENSTLEVRVKRAGAEEKFKLKLPRMPVPPNARGAR